MYCNHHNVVPIRNKNYKQRLFEHFSYMVRTRYFISFQFPQKHSVNPPRSSLITISRFHHLCLCNNIQIKSPQFPIFHVATDLTVKIEPIKRGDLLICKPHQSSTFSSFFRRIESVLMKMGTDVRLFDFWSKRQV